MTGRGASWVVAVVLLWGMSGCTSSDAIYEPHTGFWSYYDGGLLDNTCGSDDVWRDANTTFWLTNNLDGSFTIAQGDADDFVCTMSGTSFVCPQRLSISNPVTGYDATLHYHVSITGTLSSRDDMSGTQRVDVSCEGVDCTLAPLAGVTVPCSYSVAFTADKQ